MAGSSPTGSATAGGAPAIEVRGLRKTFRTRRGRRVALDSLDLVVEPGRVHGFLGPNGSGKTTTIRALLGLVRPDAGEMHLLGEPVPARLPRVVGQVGAVVEQPQFFPHFTGRRNLRLLAGVAGVSRRRVDEVLELVGLQDRGRDKVKGYSLGMRQRLAIGATLLKEPRLLILDEPGNGLDPAGIREVRDLMRRLAGSGVTVLLSSHLLAEVQHVCDAVSIVSAGRHVVTGPVSEVLAARGTPEVRVRIAEPDAAQQVLVEAGLPVRRDGELLLVGDVTDAAWVTQVLARRRLFVSELTMAAPDLESVFLDLTGTRPVEGVHQQVGEPYAAGLGTPGGASHPAGATRVGGPPGGPPAGSPTPPAAPTGGPPAAESSAAATPADRPAVERPPAAGSPPHALPTTAPAGASRVTAPGGASRAAAPGGASRAAAPSAPPAAVPAQAHRPPALGAEPLGPSEQPSRGAEPGPGPGSDPPAGSTGGRPASRAEVPR